VWVCGLLALVLLCLRLCCCPFARCCFHAQIVCCCFHAQKEAAFLCVSDLVVLCLVRVWWSCVWPFVALYFGPFGTVSPLNLMVRSSPACSRKKTYSFPPGLVIFHFPLQVPAIIYICSLIVSVILQVRLFC
jgi:hypothetical protein